MTDESTPQTDSAPASHPRRKVMVYCTVAVLVVVAAVFTGWYWRHRELYPHAKDAVLQAHYVNVMSQVDGSIAALHVDDNQFIKAGDVMIEIDPRPFQQRLTAARSKLTLVENQVDADLALVDQKRAAVDSADTQIASADADLNFAQTKFDEIAEIYADEAATRVEYQDAQDELAQATARLAEAQAERRLAQADLDATIQSVGTQQVRQARVDAAEATVQLAQIELGYTTINAPADGYVSDFNLRVGQYVESGDALFPLIESRTWWAQANYRETRVRRIRPGQPATVTVDMYPGQEFHGVVETMSRGSAAAFSLLPPENATGNWVKVTQRVPIRIRLEENPSFPFRHGASCEVTVDTVALVADHADQPPQTASVEPGS